MTSSSWHDWSVTHRRFTCWSSCFIGMLWVIFKVFPRAPGQHLQNRARAAVCPLLAKADAASSTYPLANR
jgi:hypothetical protein